MEKVYPGRMGNVNPWYLQSQVAHRVVLEAFKLEATASGLSQEQISFAESAEVRVLENYTEAGAGFVYKLRTMALKGEGYAETRTIEHVYRYNEFTTWWDHLKAQLRNWKRIPWRWRRNIRVNVTWKEVKRLDVVPVTVMRICPHHNIPMQDRDKTHFQFLLPEELKRIDRFSKSERGPALGARPS